VDEMINEFSYIMLCCRNLVTAEFCVGGKVRITSRPYMC